MAKNRPLIEKWELVLWIEINVPGAGSQQGRADGDKEVNEYVDSVFRFLSSKAESVTYREKYRERAQVGTKAIEQIDKQLRKHVAPMSSSPANEPGNPFG